MDLGRLVVPAIRTHTLAYRLTGGLVGHRLPGAPPMNLSGTTDTTRLKFLEAPAGWTSNWRTSTSRALFLVLTGAWEVTASDGEARRFSIGSPLLVEDTTGKGHQSTVTSVDGSLAVMIELARQTSDKSD